MKQNLITLIVTAVLFTACNTQINTSDQQKTIDTLKAGKCITDIWNADPQADK
ncbi:hypothetical protein [Ferruginibacter albus]|uniref:hypothetical protein n=1 Tax=Ferruginibacter albus TaxID=2875540 RepID=UPI001CC3C18F|nr:hypothetical protein [Ferruginibacter albus]UAY50870.1 hypothetical protein K9M53_09735 [Ferruginibacter albus]